ncbi:hypothetical protein [Pseudonocardia sp.]|uniref:hypothetical protein n=1 Tax=Pseudonocardia sp. TaxID=60912 RepID=UPI003D130C35
MTTVIGIAATVVALVGLLVALANLGYLGMLRSAAAKRGAAGAPFVDDVHRTLPVAGGAAALALVGLLLTSGGPVADVFGLLLGAGGGVVARNSLNATRARFRSS